MQPSYRSPVYPALTTVETLSSKQVDQKYGTDVAQLGSGSYGIVIATTKNYAIKIDMKDENYEIEGLSDTIILETSIYKLLTPNKFISPVIAAYFTPTSISLVMMRASYTLENCDWSNAKKLVMGQLLFAIDYIHKNGVIHNDIKPSNILVMDHVLKIADFGISSYGSYKRSHKPCDIVTIGYRAPELFPCDDKYDARIDVWSAGIILLEQSTELLRAFDEIKQWHLITKYLGLPTYHTWPNYDKTRHWDNYKESVYHGPPTYLWDRIKDTEERNFVQRLLQYPALRPTAAQALQNPYFFTIEPIPNNNEIKPYDPPLKPMTSGVLYIPFRIFLTWLTIMATKSQLKLGWQVLNLAILFIYDYRARKNLQENDLYHIGATALLLAGKALRRVITLEDIVSKYSDVLTATRLLQDERELMSTLDMCLLRVTAIDKSTSQNLNIVIITILSKPDLCLGLTQAQIREYAEAWLNVDIVHKNKQDTVPTAIREYLNGSDADLPQMLLQVRKIRYGK